MSSTSADPFTAAVIKLQLSVSGAEVRQQIGVLSLDATVCIAGVYCRCVLPVCIAGVLIEGSRWHSRNRN